MAVLCSGRPRNFQGGSYGEVRLYHEFRYNNQGDTEGDPGMRFTRFSYYKNNLPSLTSSPSSPLPLSWQWNACKCPHPTLKLDN